MTLGCKRKEPGSFWALWTVIEYEEKDGTEKQKVQFAPVSVADNDCIKMLSWGMEILVFTTYRKADNKSYSSSILPN